MKRIFGILFALVLTLSLVMLPAGVVQAAPDLYEHYNTGDDIISSGPVGSGWYAQTFTAESDHSITSVRLKLGRNGSPGTVTVSIRATDGTGHPSVPDLTSGTTDGDTLPTGSPWEWREIALTSYPLTSGTKYAIVVRAPDGDVSNYLRCCADAPGGYAGGNWEVSGNSGATWAVSQDIDLMFEVHGPLVAPNGPPPVEVGGDVYPVNRLALLTPWVALAAVIIAGATIAVRRRRTQS